MLVDRKVERYVQEVVRYVPPAWRGRAAKDVTDMINDMIGDYAAGREPDILDARAVIRLLGSPEEIALTWIASNESRKKEGQSSTGGRTVFGIPLPDLSFLGSKKMRSVVTIVMNVFSVLAVVLVVLGLLALGTNAISTMLPVFVGCILALVSVTGRGVLIRQY